MVLRRRPRDLHFRSGWVGANHREVEAGRKALMTGARGQDRDVARADFYLLAFIAAEANPGASARDPEHFVNCGVIVQIVVDAVAPHVSPAIGAEQVLEDPLGVIATDLDGVLI